MKINLIASKNSTGYGVVATNLFNIIQKDKSVELFFREVGSKDVILEEPDFTLGIWHHFDLSIFEGIVGPKYLYTFFERDTLPKHEIDKLNEVVDGIFVACDYSKKALRDSGYAGKLFKVHPGVDGSIFFDHKLEKEKNSPTKFFAIGKWELRKGYDILFEAFNKAFDFTNNFELHIAAENPVRCPGFDGKAISEQWASYFKSGPHADRTFIYDRLESQHDVANLINQCDVGVFLSRSEGWNLEVAESIACGKEIIVSSATSHKEFEQYGVVPIPYSSSSIAFEPPFFLGDSSWPEPTESDKQILVDELRMSLYDIRANSNSSYFKATHTWEICWNNIKLNIKGGSIG